jgi:putative oxygen-independent coproporphyrinogen III oxidase
MLLSQKELNLENLSSNTKSLAIYLHIPYCRRVCPYCDFNVFSVRNPPEDDYADALIDELKLQIEALEITPSEYNIKSIYLGGGTPTFFQTKTIAVLIKKVRGIFVNSSDIEITIEANPEDLSSNLVSELSLGGVNRLSIGVQSLFDENLELLGRKHRSQDTITRIECAARLMPNISVDLIYGLPSQTLHSLEAELELFGKLPIKHLSVYELTIELGTKFYQLYHENKLSKPDDSLLLELSELVKKSISLFGFKRYELSSYCKEDLFSVHNSNYWLGGSYLGLGAGAHSYFACSRWSNLSRPTEYIQKVRARELPLVFKEKLTYNQLLHEFFMLRLRTVTGASREEFTQHFNKTPEDYYHAELASLQDQGLVVVDCKVIKLTSKGENLADSVFAAFAK